MGNQLKSFKVFVPDNIKQDTDILKFIEEFNDFGILKKFFEYNFRPTIVGIEYEYLDSCLNEIILEKKDFEIKFLQKKLYELLEKKIRDLHESNQIDLLSQEIKNKSYTINNCRKKIWEFSSRIAKKYIKYDFVIDDELKEKNIRLISNLDISISIDDIIKILHLSKIDC